MAQTVTNPGARLAGLFADLGHKLQKGVLTEEQLALFLKKQDPFRSIYVDRSVHPVYPDWVKEVLYPEFQATGPSEYSLSSLELSLHPKQERGVATGHEVYECQKTLGFDGCLGLADLLAIQKLGLDAFRQHFQGKAVFAWKSVVRSGGGGLIVPFLIEDVGQVILSWRWIDHDWSADYPALRFAK